MSKDCGFYTAKYLLCFFNFIFFVLSTIVFAIGVWLAVDKASFIALLKLTDAENLDNFTRAPIIDQVGFFLIGFGGLMLILTFLGCFGAIRESRVLLVLYAILSILLFCAEIVILVLALYYKNETHTHAKRFLRDSILTHYASGDQIDMVTLSLNKVMSTLSCCGVDNSDDLDISQGWLQHKGNRTIPEACCVLENVAELKPRDVNCITDPNNENSYYKKGCYDILTTWLLNHREILFGVVLGVDVILFIGIFFALTICKSIGRIQRLRL